METADCDFPPLTNSLREDRRPLRAPVQGDLRQRDGVPAEEAAAAGRAAAEEE